MSNRSVIKLAPAAARMSTEMQYSSGYDPEIIKDFSKEVEEVNQYVNDLEKRCESRVSQNIGGAIKVLGGFACVAAVIIGISFAIAHWSNAVEKAERIIRHDPTYELNFLKENFIRSEFKAERPGYTTPMTIEVYSRTLE